jgi:hypothetical protein
MSGDDLLDGCVFGAATTSILFLSWSLFGAELSIIFVGFIVLGIVLKRTPLNKPKPARSRKTQPLSPSSLSRLASEADTARKEPAYTRRDVVVIPDSPVSFQRHRKRDSRPLVAIKRSLSFERGF